MGLLSRCRSAGNGLNSFSGTCCFFSCPLACYFTLARPPIPLFLITGFASLAEIKFQAMHYLPDICTTKDMHG